MEKIVKLNDEVELVFLTNKTETLALSTAIGYDKRVAWHPKKTKKTVKQLHESVEHLFDQYVEDAKRCLL